MSNRMDKDSMELVKAVLKSEIDDLIQRFHDSSGWSVTNLQIESVPIHEMGKEFPEHIITLFQIDVR